MAAKHTVSVCRMDCLKFPRAVDRGQKPASLNLDLFGFGLVVFIMN